MTARPRRPGGLLKAGLIALALMTAHVLLAPSTASLTQNWRDSIRERRAREDSRAHVERLRRVPAGNPEDLAACAGAFRDHLASKGIKLIVVVRPDREDLVGDDGGAATRCTALGSAVLKAAEALRQAKVRVVEVLPALHLMATLHPGPPPPKDDLHLSDEQSLHIGRMVAAALPEQTVEQRGRHVLFAGDCYAFRVAEQLRLHSTVDSVRVLWRNGAPELIPYEAAVLPDGEMKGIKHLVWFVGGRSLKAERGKALFPPLAQALQPRAAPAGGEQTLRVTLAQPTALPKELGAGAPYPDALISHRFRTEDGKVFAGLAPVMRQREIDPGVSHWFAGEKLLLTLSPWEAAAAAEPRLGHIQIIDDNPDFSIPRYLVTRWLHAP